MFRVPGDAFRDKNTMEWIFAHKQPGSETDDLFNDLVQERHEKIAATGGLTGQKMLNALGTGYSNVGAEDEVNQQIKNAEEVTEDVLVAMQERYGSETLENMKPAEFYRLYKSFTLGRSIE